MANISGSGIMAIDAKGVILSVDKAACALVGYSVEELVGKKINIIIPSPYDEQHDTYLQRYAKTGVKRIIGHGPRLVEAQTKQGIIIPISLNVSEITVPGKKESRFIGVLQSSEEQFAIVTLNANSGKIINVVNALSLGYADCSKLIGQHFSMLVPPPFTHEGMMEQADKVLGHTRNVVLLSGRGVVMSVAMKIESMSLGDDLSLYRCVIQVADPSIQLVFSVSQDGIIRSANHNYVETLLGRTREQLLETPFNLVVPNSFTGGEDSQINQMTHPLGATIECKALHEDGSRITVSMCVHAFKTPTGEILYSVRLNRIPDTASEAPEDSSAAPSFPSQILNYELGEEIGRGMYGRVIKSKHVQSGAIVAIKLVYKSAVPTDGPQLKRIHREIAINRKCSHRNLVHLYEVEETTEFVAFVMEYVRGGNLGDLLESKGHLEEPEMKYYCLQCLDALSYIHGVGVVHRDIKHSNILLDVPVVRVKPEWSGTVIKLIDFGLSTYNSGEFLRSYCGTPAYAAPEMLRGEEYDGPSVDIWSLGVVLFKCLTASFPFTTVSQIMNGCATYPLSLTPACTDFLSRMLVSDPNMRPSADALLQHPWIRARGSSMQPDVASVVRSDLVDEVECVVSDVGVDVMDLESVSVTESTDAEGAKRRKTGTI